MHGRRLWTLLVVLTVVVAGCDWSQFGFDAEHRAYNPLEPALTETSVQHLTQAWSAQALPNYLVADGIVYAVTPDLGAGMPEAFDVATGAQLFVTPTHAMRPAAVGNGLVYYDAGNAITALDARSGAFRWSRSVPAPGGLPAGTGYVAFDGARVFARSDRSFTGRESDTIAAMDTAGNIAWSTVPGGIVFGAIVHDGRLFVLSWFLLDSPPYGIMLLTAYDSATGDLLARFSLAAAGSDGTVDPPESTTPGPIVGPAQGSNVLFVAVHRATQSEVLAVDSTRGSILWHTLPGGLVTGMAVTPGAIVVPLTVPPGHGTEHTVALDPASGSIKWSTDTPGASSPSVAGNLVFTGTRILDLATGAVIPTNVTISCCSGIPAAGHLFINGLQAMVPSS